MMARLSISLLGGISISLDGRPVTGFESNKARALLVYLATETDRTHSREKLAALLWPDLSGQAARNNLRYTLSTVRKLIGDLQAPRPFLCISGQTIQLNLEGNVEVDVLTFNERLAQLPLTLVGLEEAINLYRGDFLEGFSIGDSTVFEEWIILKREQLRRQALEALHRLAQSYEKNGDVTSALAPAWRRVELEPWSEEAHRYLMRVLALSGQRSAALTQYEACRRVLAGELGVDPSIETTRLYEQIRDGEIKPLSHTQEITYQSEKQIPGKPAEPLPAISGSEDPKPRANGRLKIVGFVLLITSLAAAVIFFLGRSTGPTPATTSVKGEIVVLCPEDNRQRICVTDAQTGRLIQVMDTLALDRIGPGLSWAPDGGRIVFSASSNPKEGMNDNFDLFLIDADGANLQQITTGDEDDFHPAWSPDGMWIAFQRNCNLWIMKSDGTQAEALSYGLCVMGIAWSPNSQWIAFLDTFHGTNGQPLPTIRLFQQDGSDSKIVYTFDQALAAGRLAWSPDGQEIFCVYYTEDKKEHTLLININGQGEVKQDIQNPVTWFPDFLPQWAE
jgi:DNA-binding SARP family transcriptional activator